MTEKFIKQAIYVSAIIGRWRRKSHLYDCLSRFLYLASNSPDSRFNSLAWPNNPDDLQIVTELIVKGCFARQIREITGKRIERRLWRWSTTAWQTNILSHPLVSFYIQCRRQGKKIYISANLKCIKSGHYRMRPHSVRDQQILRILRAGLMSKRRLRLFNKELT